MLTLRLWALSFRCFDTALLGWIYSLIVMVDVSTTEGKEGLAFPVRVLCPPPCPKHLGLGELQRNGKGTEF